MSVSQVMYEAQDFLSIGQAIPIVGSSLLSPVKAGFSVIQTIYGLAKGVFFRIASCFASTETQALKEKSFQALAFARSGLGHLAYSIVNFYTLGFFGLCVELINGAVYPCVAPARVLSATAIPA